MSERTDLAKIEPALSAEEWSEEGKPLEAFMGRDTAAFLNRSVDDVVHFVLRSHDTWRGERYTAAVFARPSSLAAIIALANAALPDDDPRKITRATVSLLTRAVQVIQASGDDGIYWLEVLGLGDLADALASYLPPERP